MKFSISRDWCEQAVARFGREPRQLTPAVNHAPFGRTTMPLPYLVYVIGPTNAGKSTLLNYAATQPDVGLVEVGKMMRAKYPPEHFKGQSNPAHTAAEAWQMYLDGVHAHTVDPKLLVLIDGQPRDREQTSKILGERRPRLFLHLWAPEDVRRARAELRDAGHPGKLELSLQRMTNDPPQLYDVLSRLHAAGEVLHTVDTSSDRYTVDAQFAALSYLAKRAALQS